MHSYLRSIGFYHITKNELDQLLYEIKKKPDSHEVIVDNEGNEFVELRCALTSNMGIAMRGTYDPQDEFHMDYYYPYCENDVISSEGVIEIIKQSDRESYQGLCDEIRLGVNLIFFLQNMIECLQKGKEKEKSIQGVRLCALSIEGKVLLPIYRSEKHVKNTLSSSNDRNTLVAAAREGDEEAIESLTLEDIDMYSMLSKRVQKEDVLSIVTTTFMPYGIESDKYAVIGDILEVRKKINPITMESVYELLIECNEIEFLICINTLDLLGEPEVGRRFKGYIWMQGTIEL